jgi:DNA-3-methyladenine glycosylase I
MDDDRHFCKDSKDMFSVVIQHRRHRLYHCKSFMELSTSRSKRKADTIEIKDDREKKLTTSKQNRCSWAGSDPNMIRYHDEEWGVPSHCDRYLFEMLILEGAQAGLSWQTILKKRNNYRSAFDNFDIQKIADYDAAKVAELLDNPGIVRNRLKIMSAVTNAKSALLVQEEFGTLDNYFWTFADPRPIRSEQRFVHYSELPTQTALSECLSTDLKKRGFKFVGPTIIYAFMQAVGLVDDHTFTCFKSGSCGNIIMDPRKGKKK